jgi:hypothetical protein
LKEVLEYPKERYLNKFNTSINPINKLGDFYDKKVKDQIFRFYEDVALIILAQQKSLPQYYHDEIKITDFFKVNAESILLPIFPHIMENDRACENLIFVVFFKNKRKKKVFK